MDFLSILRSNGPQKKEKKSSVRTRCWWWFGLLTLTCMICVALTTELTECKISNIPFEILWSFKLQTRDSRDEKTNKIKLQSFLFHSFPRQIRPGIILKFHPTNKQSDSIKYIFHKINERESVMVAVYSTFWATWLGVTATVDQN